jgi:deazaflavin-dependent oxidoreductase (nitroreductase family)
MADDRFRRRFLDILKRTVNPLAMRVARSGHGPFSIVRHVGRKSGTTYETPLIVAAVDDGFIAELTYGPNVSWYRNAVAAGNCVLVVGGVEHRIDHHPILGRSGTPRLRISARIGLEDVTAQRISSPSRISSVMKGT